jgi:hypothetical protein
MEDALRHGRKLSARLAMHAQLMSSLRNCLMYFESMGDTKSDTTHLTRPHISRLQKLLVIAFRYALMLAPDNSQTDRAVEVLLWTNGILNEILQDVRRRVAGMEGTSTNGNGIFEFLYEMLFYEYKRLFVLAELSARAHPADERDALHLYAQAMEVWWERHKIYPIIKLQRRPRSDQEIQIDPFSEAFETLYRLAVLSCSSSILLLSTPPQKMALLNSGLANVSNSHVFHDEVWGSVEHEHLPEQVQVMRAKTLVAEGDCWRQNDHFLESKGSYVAALEILAKIPSLGEQTAGLMAYVESSITYIVNSYDITEDIDTSADGGDIKRNSRIFHEDVINERNAAAQPRPVHSPAAGGKKKVFRRRRPVKKQKSRGDL